MTKWGPFSKCCQLLRKHGISVSSCSRPLPTPPPHPLPQPRRDLPCGPASLSTWRRRGGSGRSVSSAEQPPSRISPARPPRPVRADDRDTNHVAERPAYVGALPKRDISLCCCCTMFYGDRLRTAQCTWVVMVDRGWGVSSVFLFFVRRIFHKHLNFNIVPFSRFSPALKLSNVYDFFIVSYGFVLEGVMLNRSPRLAGVGALNAHTFPPNYNSCLPRRSRAKLWVATNWMEHILTKFRKYRTEHFGVINVLVTSSLHAISDPKVVIVCQSIKGNLLNANK